MLMTEFGRLIDFNSPLVQIYPHVKKCDSWRLDWRYDKQK